MNCTKRVWKGLGLLKPEILVWFVLLERLNTKDRLRKFNIVDEEEAR